MSEKTFFFFYFFQEKIDFFLIFHQFSLKIRKN